MRTLLNLWAVGACIGVSAASFTARKTCEGIVAVGEDGLAFLDAFDAGYSARIRGL